MTILQLIKKNPPNNGYWLDFFCQDYLTVGFFFKENYQSSQKLTKSETKHYSRVKTHKNPPALLVLKAVVWPINQRQNLGQWV